LQTGVRPSGIASRRSSTVSPRRDCVADERVVATQLERIEQYHGELRTKQQELTRRELRTDTTEQRAVERVLENVIQACADLAKHIAATDFGFDGETSKDAIEVLRRAGVIDAETAATLVAAVGFRNVLAHQYGSVD
jgi:uncharacterized protein YutE (UPF0331/DUF86 family)